MTMTQRDLRGTIRERINAADGSPEGRVEWQQNEASPTIRLWDVVWQAWTLPLPANTLNIAGRPVYQLNQTTHKCSACTFTGHAGGVAPHLLDVREKAEMHVAAAVEQTRDDRVGVLYRCTGCGSSSARRHAMGLHIDAIRRDSLSHRGEVKELTIRSFTLGPSEPSVLAETLVSAGDGGPVASQVEGEEPRRKRNRRRRRNRSRS